MLRQHAGFEYQVMFLTKKEQSVGWIKRSESNNKESERIG